MTGIRRTICVPSPVLAALLVLAGLVGDAQVARAGCHVADPPPTLGRMLNALNADFAPLALIDQMHQEPSVPVAVPRHCQDETPAPTAAISVFPSASAVLAQLTPPANSIAARLLAPEPAVTYREFASRLDRPPR